MAEQFYTILTAIGKAKIANAAALGQKVELTELALGDGGGSYYNPTEDQTELRNEVWRGVIGAVTVDEKNPTWITIQTVVPSQHGGFMIREAGVFDDEGDLIAVGKYPETYKPVAADGSIKDLVIRMILEVSNTSSVVLKVDPTVILVTQQQVNEAEARAKAYTDREVDAAEARAKAYTDQEVAEVSQALDEHLNNKNNPHNVTPEQIGAETPQGAQAKANQAEANAKAASVPTSRTINGKALSSDIYLTAADVGAVPTSRTVNGLALSSNITLNHNHVGAVNAVSTGSTADPNTTQEPYILTNHANSPGLGVYWHIHTYFYSSKTGNRAQQAISYNGAETRMFVRHNYDGSWTPWKELGGGGVGMLQSYRASNTDFKTVSGTSFVLYTSVNIAGDGLLEYVYVENMFDDEHARIEVVINGNEFLVVDDQPTETARQELGIYFKNGCTLNFYIRKTGGGSGQTSRSIHAIYAR